MRATLQPKTQDHAILIKLNIAFLGNSERSPARGAGFVSKVTAQTRLQPRYPTGRYFPDRSLRKTPRENCISCLLWQHGRALFVLIKSSLCLCPALHGGPCSSARPCLISGTFLTISGTTPPLSPLRTHPEDRDQRERGC